MNKGCLNLLLVEDCLEDVQLTKMALNRSGANVNLTVANNGEECLELLSECLKGNGKTLPDMILLDLNMPKKGGKEVLRELKMDSKLKHIPVIVLTTSQSVEDIEESYFTHANGYLNKPLDFHDFLRLIKSIQKFWFNTVRLPMMASL